MFCPFPAASFYLSSVHAPRSLAYTGCRFGVVFIYPFTLESFIMAKVEIRDRCQPYVHWLKLPNILRSLSMKPRLWSLDTSTPPYKSLVYITTRPGPIQWNQFNDERTKKENKKPSLDLEALYLLSPATSFLLAFSPRRRWPSKNPSKYSSKILTEENKTWKDALTEFSVENIEFIQ